MAISDFDIMLLAHLTGDFLFQNQWMALNKQKRALPLLVHCTVYTAMIYLFSLLLLAEPLSWFGVLFVFVTHVILDQGAFIRFWAHRITSSTGAEAWWLKIVYDQIFHLMILYAVLWMR